MSKRYWILVAAILLGVGLILAQKVILWQIGKRFKDVDSIKMGLAREHEDRISKMLLKFKAMPFGSPLEQANEPTKEMKELERFIEDRDAKDQQFVLSHGMLIPTHNLEFDERRLLRIVTNRQTERNDRAFTKCRTNILAQYSELETLYKEKKITLDEQTERLDKLTLESSHIKKFAEEMVAQSEKITELQEKSAIAAINAEMKDFEQKAGAVNAEVSGSIIFRTINVTLYSALAGYWVLAGSLIYVVFLKLPARYNADAIVLVTVGCVIGCVYSCSYLNWIFSQAAVLIGTMGIRIVGVDAAISGEKIFVYESGHTQAMDSSMHSRYLFSFIVILMPLMIFLTSVLRHRWKFNVIQSIIAFFVATIVGTFLPVFLHGILLGTLGPTASFGTWKLAAYLVVIVAVIYLLLIVLIKKVYYETLVTSS